MLLVDAESFASSGTWLFCSDPTFAPELVRASASSTFVMILSRGYLGTKDYSAATVHDIGIRGEN
jgi:hypothetical protein